MSSSLRSRYSLAVGILAFFAFALATVFSRSVFERLPHLEDEVAYLYQAKVFARGQIVGPLLENRRAFWQPFVVDDTKMGTRFGKYTPGWPVALSFGVAWGEPWVINAFLAAITVALVYRLGSALFNRDVGLIAAILITFSPMLILLNATLMGHTMAICLSTGFIYCYWRLERDRRPLKWGLLAGFLLGMLAISRPLSAVAVAAPFIAWSGIRLLMALVQSFKTRKPDFLLRPLSPLIALGIVTVLLAIITPIFNYAATGNPRENLYQRVWSYDIIGFGPCCGRSGHTLEKGFRHARYDLSLTAADTFGWQTGGFGPDVVKYLLVDGTYFPNRGYSLFLIPIGLLIGVGLWQKRSGKNRWSRSDLMRLGLCALWLAGAWGLWSVQYQWPAEIQQIPEMGWVWLVAMLSWVMLPIVGFISLRSETARYTWLLWAVLMCVLILQFTYWIGSARYSTRYYAEAITAAAILTAVVLAWVMRFFGRWPVYIVLVGVTLYGFWMYSVPRVQLLYRYNEIEQSFLDAINERRDGRPLLVIIRGPETGDDRVRWRALGELMAVTSPFGDSDIVGVWDYQAEGLHDKLIAQFPGRQVIEMEAIGNEAWFADSPPAP
jgi:4-amino-4-deoxy-L-arabinose transferase-like glycosyltransferase